MSFLLTTIDERINDAKVSGNGEPWICVSLIKYFLERHQIPCVLCKFDRFSPLNKILPLNQNISSHFLFFSSEVRPSILPLFGLKKLNWGCRGNWKHGGDGRNA